MFDKVTGVNSNVVAMIPVAVFCITGVITKRDLEEISWSVLWMVAGGFALGVALQETGLAKHMIEAIPFNTWPPVLMIVKHPKYDCDSKSDINHNGTPVFFGFTFNL